MCMYMVVISMVDCFREYDSSVSFGKNANVDDDEPIFELHWSMMNANSAIKIGIKAKTSAWMGFGISSTGSSKHVLLFEHWANLNFQCSHVAYYFLVY
jgi:hypothetical protein